MIMNHERLIKRSRVIEGRLAGNIFSTVAIDKDENIIGCGCRKLYDFPQKGYVSLSTELVSSFAITNSGGIEYKSLTPYYYDSLLMPYIAFDISSEESIKSYDLKKVEYDNSIIAALYRDGTVAVCGYCEAGEEVASEWKDIDDILIFNDGVLGVTKKGTIVMCGSGAELYQEMTTWTNVAYVKKISAGYRGCDYDGFVALKNDGTLLYSGGDVNFANHVVAYEDVVSFDGWVDEGIMRTFYVVLSDGSMYMYSPASEFMPMVNKKHYKEDFIAVKYLPSGPHFIKRDGTIETVPSKVSYPNEITSALITLTGENYDVVYEANRRAESNPLANDVTGWKLFDDPDEVLRRYEGYESRSFMKNNKCLYCGGDLKKTFFSTKCSNCGKKHIF